MKKREHKCLSCEHIKCINFRREIDELEGGEIYLLEKTFNKKIHVPCEMGSLIYSLCQMSSPLGKVPSFLLFNQCIRDIRAIAFLILTGHYRNAIQIMRPVIEIWLTGIYWNSKYNIGEEDQKKVDRQYEEYQNSKNYQIPEDEYKKIFPNKGGKRYLNHHFILSWLIFNLPAKDDKTKHKLNKMKPGIQKTIGVLNRYLHPNFPATEVSKPNCTSCPSAVKYDEESYRFAVEIFQQISTYLLDQILIIIRRFYPEEESKEYFQEALGYVTEMPELEEEIGKQLIYSKILGDFIETESCKIKRR